MINLPTTHHVAGSFFLVSTAVLSDSPVRTDTAGAGMAAALPGVIAANTTLPVIGVPIKGMLDGLAALHYNFKTN